VSPEIVPVNPEVEALLVEAGLPVSDLSAVPDLGLLGIREHGRFTGVIGLEVHGHHGLLRSLAVSPACRNAGLGRALVSSAESWAAGRGVDTLYLLTTTAAGFFERLGYETLPRTEAPESIRSTHQFSQLCPTSSTFMRKALGSPEGSPGTRPGAR
jgi:amino-acid N-acetyltransferase